MKRASAGTQSAGAWAFVKVLAAAKEGALQ